MRRLGGLAVLMLAAVLLAPLRTLLGTRPLPPGQLLVAVAVAALPGCVLALARARHRYAVRPSPGSG